jgi:aldehyde:ferredoxin oxidoreductase
MAGGYAGKILQVNLTDRTFGTIDTEEYSDKFFGGFGIGTALFFDRAPREPLDGLDPKNVVIGITGPLSGTGTPYSGGRIDWDGVAPHAYARDGSNNGWFSRSGHGGRFPGALKQAGWDGIVIEGVASSPVWLNIVNDEVTLEDASELWGMDTKVSAVEIYRRVTGASHKWGEWRKLSDGSYTAVRPAVVGIGPVGESPGGRLGALTHDSGMGAGEGGYGSAWGSKNLKAISAVGTKGIDIANPKAMLAEREWFMNNLHWNVDEVKPEDWRGRPYMTNAVPSPEPTRIGSCESCPGACRGGRRQSSLGNDQRCSASSWFSDYYAKDPVWYGRLHPDYVDPWTQVMDITLPDAPVDGIAGRVAAMDIMDRWCPDARQSRELMNTIKLLHMMGIAGPGGAANGFEINTDPLPMDRYGTIEFVAKYMKAIADRDGIGEAVSLGMPRFANFYNKYDEWYEAGILNDTGWGYEYHHTLPNAEWALSDLVTERDNNEHIRNDDVSGSLPDVLAKYGKDANYTVERLMTMTGVNDKFMFDYTWQGQDGSGMAQALETGVYSKHMAKHVSWNRYYSHGYIQTAPFCCFLRGGIHGPGPDFNLSIHETYPRFVKAVTGKDISWSDQIGVIGRRGHNLRRVIHVLQGRHRDLELLSPYLSKQYQNFQRKSVMTYNRATDQFEYGDHNDMWLDRDGVEAWKTHYYNFNGWDSSTGWPNRATLEDLDLGYAADALESAGKLGAPGATYEGFE